MFLRSSILRNRVSLAIGLGCALSLQNTFTYCKEKEAKRNEQELIGVYLKPDSIALLEKFLKSRGIQNRSAEFVALHPSASPETAYVYRPLFGERVAFRLKGIIHLPDGRTVGIGRLSTMVGEIRDEHVDVSLPFFPTADQKQQYTPEQVREILDLPTRLHRLPQVAEKAQWRGTIPAGSVLSKHYPAQKVVYTSLPVKQQLVIDGYMCSDQHYCGENKICKYEAALDPYEHPAHESVPSSSASSDTSSDEDVFTHESAQLAAEQEAKEGNKESPTTGTPSSSSQEGEVVIPHPQPECPICRFLKGGPCKEEFLAWDGCLKSLTSKDDLHTCYQQTKTMMTCMQQYEYYDIMIAGTDFAKMEQMKQEAESSPEKKEEQGSSKKEKGENH
jgi:intermembrane space import and assembly protein 40